MGVGSGITDELLLVAMKARKKAYAPYSDFNVGAAILTIDGDIITGANIENISSGLTICAERVAIFSAIAAGHYRFSSIAVVSKNEHHVFPCGACRQVLWELAGNIEVIVSNLKNDIIKISLSELLPHPFAMEGISSPMDYFKKRK